MNNRLRHMIKGVAIIAGLVLVTMIGLYLLRGALIGPRLADWLEKRLESETGLAVSIQNIGGTYFSDLIIEDLSLIEPAQYSSLAALNVDRIRLKYHLAALLDGVDRFLASMSIEVQQADMTLDWRLPAQKRQMAPARPFQLPAALPMGDIWPRLRIDQSSLTLRAAGASTRLDNLSAGLQPDARGNIAIELQANPWRWQIASIAAGNAPLKLKMTYHSDAALVLDSLTVGRNALTASARLDLEALPHSLPFAARSQFAEGTLQLSGRIRQEAITIDFQAEKHDLGTISAIFAFLESKIEGTLAGKGDVRIAFQNPQQFDGSLAVSIRNAGYRRLAAEALTLTAAARSGAIAVEKLQITGEKNRAAIEQVTLPAALWAAPDHLRWLAGLKGQFNLRLQDIPALLDMLFPGYAESWPELPPHVLALDGALEDDGRVRAEGGLSTGDNHIRLAPSQARLSFSEGRLENAALDARLKIDIYELNRITRLFPLPQMQGGLTGEITVGGSLGQPNGRAVLTGRQMALKQVPLGKLEAVFSLAQNKVTAERLFVGDDQNSLRIEGGYLIDEHILENVRLRFQMARIQPFLNLWSKWPQTLRGDLQGSLQADGALQAPTVRVQARSQTLTVENLALSDIRLQATHTNGRLQADSIEVTVFGGSVKTAGTLLYTAGLKSFDAQLQKLAIKRKDAALDLAKPGRISFAAPGTLTFSDVQLTGQMGQIRLDGPLALKGDSDLNLQIQQLQSTGWLSELSGRQIEFDGLNARGRIGGDLSDPQIVIAGDVARLSSPYIPVPLSGNFDLAYAKGRLHIERLTWSDDKGHRAAVSGLVPLPCRGNGRLPQDRLTIDANLNFPDARVANLFLRGEPILSGALSAGLNVTGTWQEPVGELRFEARDVTTARERTGLPPGPMQLKGDVVYRDGRLNLNTFVVDSANLAVSGQGHWIGGLAPAMLCRPGTEELTGQVVFDAKVSVADLGWLGASFTGVRRIGGRLEADLRARGPIAEPDVSASLVFDKGELRMQADLPALEAVELNARITPDRIEIEQMQGFLGGARVHLEGAVDNPLQDNPAFDLHLWGENLLYYREQGLRLRADTDLRLRGQLQALALTGEVAVADGLYDRYIDWLGGLQGGRAPASGRGIRLFSLRDPPLRDMRIDVQIRTQYPFRVRSNLFRAELRPDLRLFGTGAAPLLVGRILVDQADLRLPSGTVVFEQGLVRFTEIDPDRPVLDLVGSTRVLGYDVTVLIEGPYDDPVVTLSSSPPLSNEDLLLLVLTGTPPPREGRTIDQRQRNLNVAVYIGRDLIQRWFQGGGDTPIDAILERFEAEVGRDITRKGEETLEARFRLQEGVFREKDTLYITAEKDVYDYYNAGLRLVFRFQ